MCLSMTAYLDYDGLEYQHNALLIRTFCFIKAAIKSWYFTCLFFSLQHAPGVPRILVGNRLHLAFKRQVPTEQARAYAEKNGMTFFEVSPLCNFNVIESFTELSRIVLMRHGMEKFWRPNRGELIMEQ